MSNSKSLLKSAYYDKLLVNKLEAISIKSNKNVDVPSYLYSIILPNATFERNNNGGVLSFNRFSEDINIIEFTDRPLRQSSNITIDEFINLFLISANDSFKLDPPNGVLVHDEEQRTYSIKLFENNRRELDIVKFHLDLLPGETHNLNNITGKMSFFVDNENTQVNEYIYINTYSYIMSKTNSKFDNIRNQLDSSYDYITFDESDINNDILWIQEVDQVSSTEIEPGDNSKILLKLISGSGTNTNYTECSYQGGTYNYQIEKQYRVNLSTGEIITGPVEN